MQKDPKLSNMMIAGFAVAKREYLATAYVVEFKDDTGMESTMRHASNDAKIVHKWMRTTDGWLLPVSVVCVCT